MGFQFPTTLRGERKIYFIPTLNLTSCFLGLCLMAICLSCSLCLLRDLHPTDAFQVFVLLGVLALFGLYVTLVGCKGRHLAFVYTSPTMRTCQRCEMIIWLISAVVCILLALGYLAAVPAASTSLHCYLRDSMSRGMNLYLQDATWKKVYDRLQPRRHCCGVNNHTDWKQTPWISLDQIKEGSNAILDYMKPDGSILPPVVPYSCCKPGAGGHCLHDSLQQKALIGHVKDDGHDGIYTEGCFPRINLHLARTVNAALVFIALICIAQVAVLVVTVYVHVVNRAHDVERRTASVEKYGTSEYEKTPPTSTSEDLTSRRRSKTNINMS